MFVLLASTREELGALPGHPLGVGSILAAANCARLLEQLRPSAAVMIGTGSAYRGGPAIGSVVAVEQIGFSPGVAAMGLGYVPRAPRPLECDPDLLARIPLPRARALTVAAVTTDAVLADRLGDGWDVEHIECYGAAVACAQAGVPFAAIIGITAQAGPDAHESWLSRRAAAQDRARAAAEALLETVNF